VVRVAVGNPQSLGFASLGSSAPPPCPSSLHTPPSLLVGQQPPHWLNPQVYVLKRPHVDEFLQRMGELFECVLFTASLAKVSPQPGVWDRCSPGSLPALGRPSFYLQYADPVADLLDKWGAFRARLFRESCVFHRGNYVKDLSRLGRDLRRVLILDNSPASYVFHPDNAVSAPWTQGGLRPKAPFSLSGSPEPHSGQCWGLVPSQVFFLPLTSVLS
jgi:hypothetical protein